MAIIPDLSTTPLYAAVVLDTRDDPRLLALWCHYAFWAPVDAALGQGPDAATWAERTQLTPAVLTQLTRTLISRQLLTAEGRVPRWRLQEASTRAVRPYADELRRRVGLAPLGPAQGILFGQPEEPSV